MSAEQPTQTTTTVNLDNAERNVLVLGVDGSNQSVEAFRMATKLSQPQDKFHIVHVRTTFDRTYWLLDTQFPNVHTEDDNKKAVRWADHVRHKFEKLCEESKRDCSFEVLQRPPSTADIGDAICSEYKKVGGKAVVLGSHGYTATERFILGSVANFMVNHCDCNLLVVKSKSHQ